MTYETRNSVDAVSAPSMQRLCRSLRPRLIITKPVTRNRAAMPFRVALRAGRSEMVSRLQPEAVGHQHGPEQRQVDDRREKETTRREGRAFARKLRTQRDEGETQ